MPVPPNRPCASRLGGITFSGIITPEGCHSGGGAEALRALKEREKNSVRVYHEKTMVIHHACSESGIHVRFNAEKIDYSDLSAEIL